MAGQQAAVDQRPQESPELDDPEDPRANRRDRQHELDGGAGVQHRDRHIEDRDRLDQVRAKDAERAAMVGRDEHLDQPGQ